MFLNVDFFHSNEDFHSTETTFHSPTVNQKYIYTLAGFTNSTLCLCPMSKLTLRSRIFFKFYLQFSSEHAGSMGSFHYAKDSGNFGRNSNEKVCFGFFRPEYSGSPLEVVPFLTNRLFALIREFGKGIKHGKSHSHWLARFNRELSFHFPRVFPLISDRSVWHNGKHPIFWKTKGAERVDPSSDPGSNPGTDPVWSRRVDVPPRYTNIGAGKLCKHLELTLAT